MNKKYGGRVQFADIEDAVSCAMVDLVDYWVHLPSSIAPENPDRNYCFAVTRGGWMAAAHVRRIVNEQAHTTPLDEMAAYHPDLRQPGPEPEDFEPDEEQQAREFLATLPEEEFSSWLEDYLAGRTVRASAQREDVTFAAIHQRRTWGLRRLRRRYHEYVMVKGG